MTSDPIRILVAEDDFAVRESMVELLENYGHTVTGAGATSEALKTIRDQEFDLAIVDMRLPEIGGEQLICQAAATCPQLKFLVCTGSIDLMLPESLSVLGMDEGDLIFKPIRDIDSFVQHIVEKCRNS